MKRAKIDYLLSLIKEKTEELLGYEELKDASAEELLLVSIKEVMQAPIAIKYSMPVGVVDIHKVMFRLDTKLGEMYDVPVSSKNGDYHEDEN